MGRVGHFEIHVDDMERAKAFYEASFGWIFEDYSEYVGAPYFTAITGEDDKLGINGALMQREKPLLKDSKALSSVLTIIVEDYDVTESKILKKGGKVYTPKYALEGMAWQGYYEDSEGNVFGIHQPDENAK